MPSDGRVVFEVAADSSGLKTDLQRATKEIQSETKNWDKAAADSANNMGNSFGSMLKKLTAGFAAMKVGSFLLDLGKESISLASDLQEVQNVVDTTFGKSGAREIETWAKNAGQQFGLTEIQAKKFTSTLGAMMKSSGIAGSEIVGMSKNLAGLAADMASFYNLDFEEAFQKIRSGISGETEPLKQLGINMSVANLNAFALKQGLEKTFEQMTQGEQTMLRYQYLMSATADAQGDFARTSDGYANSVRLLETNLTELKTKLGGVLSEVINPLLEGVNSLFATKKKRRTVLDDVNEINLETNEKIGEIRRIAAEAEACIAQLEVIADSSITSDFGTITTSANDAKNSISNFTDELNKVIVKDTTKDQFSTAKTELDGVKESGEGAKDSINDFSDEVGKVNIANDSKKQFGGLSDDLSGISGNGASAKTAISELAQELNSAKVSDDAKQTFENTLSVLWQNIGKISEITGEDAAGVVKWLLDVGDAANGIDASDAEAWEALNKSIEDHIPGLAEASTAAEGVKNLGTELNKIDINAGAKELFTQTLTVFRNNIDDLSKITGKDADGVADWLANIAEEAEKLDPDDAEAWATLLGALFQEVPEVFNSDEGKQFASALTEQFLAMGSESETAKAGLAALGYSTEEIEKKQEEWLKTCKQLVQTIPGLSEVINSETGEVKGGIGAISDYVEEWRKGQEKLYNWKSYYRKKDKIQEAKDELYGYRIEAEGYKRLLVEEMQTKGLSVNGFNAEDVAAMTVEEAMTTFAPIAMSGGGFYKYAKPFYQAARALKENTEAVAESEKLLEAAGRSLDDEFGHLTREEAEAANGALDVSTNVDKLTESITNASTAIAELESYIDSVHEKIQATINGAIKGFGAIETPMMKNAAKVRELQAAQEGLNSADADYEEKLRKINDELAKQRGEQVSAASMAKNLKGQAEYIDAYLANLRKARELGFSDEVLAALSDGSEESFDYLAAMAEATPEQVEQINAGYAEVSQKKQELANELTKQQLTVDQTYQTLAEAAKQAIAELDLEEEAATNAGKTVTGMVRGISDKVPELQAAVDEVCGQLSRLEGWGISIDLSDFGTVTFGSRTTVESGAVNSKNRNERIEGFRDGLNWVPYDDFLARLHEGEAVLTAEENRIWQGIKAGGAIDYDNLGGVMRDNIKPGGNVYLDGKIVGSVISDNQGRSFRSLQRSGWQS